MRDDFRFEDPKDYNTTAHVYECECGAIALAVSEEKAVDSYNSTFECTVYLPRDQATQLRDYLTKILTSPQNIPRKKHDYSHY